MLISGYFSHSNHLIAVIIINSVLLGLAKLMQEKHILTKEEKERNELCKKWNEEGKALENIPMYSRNETMFLLGKQSLDISGQLLKDYENVKAAHRDFVPFQGVYDLAHNMLSLGIIYGIRKERKRRKCRG